MTDPDGPASEPLPSESLPSDSAPAEAATSESPILALLKGPLVKAVFLVLGVASVVFVVDALVEAWPQFTDVVADATVPPLLAGIAVMLVAELGYAVVWPLTLRRMEFPAPMVPAAATFAVTQTAKFVPGSVWHAVGRVEASRRFGLPRRLGAASMLVEAGASLAASLTIAGALGAPSAALEHDGALALLENVGVVVAGAVAYVVGLEVARRVGGRPSWRGAAEVYVGHLLVWATWSVGAALVGWSLGIDEGAAVAAAFCLSWAAGFVVVGVPAGLGVREAVMTAALGRVMPTADALAITLGTRTVWTFVQFGAAGIGVGALGRGAFRASTGAMGAR